MPVKQKSNSHFGSNFWEGFSTKLNRNVFFYSELEYENWIMTECNPSIKTFCEQPLKISGYVDNQYKESIFDMWIQWIDGTEEFLEIKYEKDIKNINNSNHRISYQIKLQKQWCMKNRFNHRIITEKDIRVYPLLNNSKILVSHLKNVNKTSEIISFKIVKMLKKSDQTIKGITINLKEHHISEIYRSICYLYLKNLVYINLKESNFDQNMKVSLVNETI